MATGAGTNAQAGGFNVFGSSFTVRSSTIAGNSAPIGANLTGGSVAQFANTLVAEPLGGGPNCNAPVTSAGYNLESADSCGFGKASDQPSTDPLLAAGGPASNGGPTATIALLDGSPAIDAGLSAVGEVVDQRGLTRPVEIPGVADASGRGRDGYRRLRGPAAGGPRGTRGTGGSRCSGDADGSRNRRAAGRRRTRRTALSRRRTRSAPKATIRGLKAKTTARRLRIRFSSSEAGSSFRCRLDRKAYLPCHSPLKTKKLALGATPSR